MNGRLILSQSATFAFGLAVFLTISSCSSSNAQAPMITRISNAELVTLMEKSTMQLVDVRTPGEYGQGHLAGAELIDYTQPGFKEKVSKLDKDAPIIVYCAVGGRSARAAQVLASAGFKEIYDLKQGIRGWLAEGRTVE